MLALLLPVNRASLTDLAAVAFEVSSCLLDRPCVGINVGTCARGWCLVWVLAALRRLFRGRCRVALRRQYLFLHISACSGRDRRVSRVVVHQ